MGNVAGNAFHGQRFRRRKSDSWESIWHEDCSLITALSYIKDGNILQTMTLTADSQTILALLGIGAWHALTQLTILNQFATATNSGTGEDRKRTNGTHSKCLWDYGCRDTSYIPHFAGKSQCKGHQFACWGGSQHFNHCKCAKTTTLRSFADTELRHRPQLGNNFTLYTLGALAAGAFVGHWRPETGSLISPFCLICFLKPLIL